MKVQNKIKFSTLFFLSSNTEDLKLHLKFSNNIWLSNRIANLKITQVNYVHK